MPTPERVCRFVVVALLVSASASADEPTARPNSAFAPGGKAVRPRPPLEWEHDAFSTGDYAVTLSAAAVTLTTAIVAPLPRHVRGGWIFDESVRTTLRLSKMNNRYLARDLSDVGLSLAVTWPFFADALMTAWWHRGSREVAREMALIDLETLGITAAVQGTTNVLVSRERPFGRDCGGELPAQLPDCNGATRYRSFFSGHSALSFASAALICVHHFENALLASPYDALSCATGYVVATTVATLRIAADMHYVTDALTGALMGSVIGYGVPLVHYRNHRALTIKAGDVRLHIVPALGGAAVSGVF